MIYATASTTRRSLGKPGVATASRQTRNSATHAQRPRGSVARVLLLPRCDSEHVTRPGGRVSSASRAVEGGSDACSRAQGEPGVFLLTSLDRHRSLNQACGTSSCARLRGPCSARRVSCWGVRAVEPSRRKRSRTLTSASPTRASTRSGPGGNDGCRSPGRRRAAAPLSSWVDLVGPLWEMVPVSASSLWISEGMDDRGCACQV